MKQLLQRLDTGETSLANIPVPSVSGPNILVQTRASVISAGTERTLVEFGRSSLMEKARSQPEKVRQVLDKVRTDGLGSTLEAVRSKLETPIPVGYCQAGVVIEAGNQAARFEVGCPVVTNGSHAEYVRVPITLAAQIPPGVSFEAAAFTPVAAIGLQAIRLAQPTLGETVVVLGLGLIGLLTVQMLRANGCEVIGVDIDPERLALSERFGARAVEAGESTVARVLAATGGVGADAVLLTLASTSDEPLRQAAAMSRKRGRLVLVGVTGLNLVRDDFYKKELSFTVSCSYGPGRYDPRYEDAAQDYPLPYVRWTEQRNFEAVLGLMRSGQVDPLPLVTHRFEFSDAPAAYELITRPEPSLGIVLTYPEREAPRRQERTISLRPIATEDLSAGVVGVVGAGNFAVRTLLPLLRQEGARLHSIVSSGGTSGAIAGSKFGFGRVTTDLQSMLDSPEIDTVFLLTRHDTHASLAVRALEAGKHVFVEKPLALTRDELEDVSDAASRCGRKLLVGFNRRFAPLTAELRREIEGRSGPLVILATVNAGPIPQDHWTQDPEVGGGRIVGEACHWLDLARSLVGHTIIDIEVTAARSVSGAPIDDIAHLAVRFADGSTAVIHYLANGSRSFPKERIDCFFDGKTITIDNWRRLLRYGAARPLFRHRRKMDKGHRDEVRAWLNAIRTGGASPIPLNELLEVSDWAIRAAEQARGGAGYVEPS